jgi:hypothetical protein
MDKNPSIHAHFPPYQKETGKTAMNYIQYQATKVPHQKKSLWYEMVIMELIEGKSSEEAAKAAFRKLNGVLSSE